MVDSTATSGNLVKGGQLFVHNYGIANTFLGANAGNLTMTGYRNTASGTNALSSNANGYANTAIGYASLNSNTAGSQNTASGYLSLSSNTTGNNDMASGFNSLFSNTTGRQNTASGSASLQLNTTGSDNTASGYGSLSSNTTGSANTASGSASLQLNTTGNNNMASGSASLFSNTTGTGNTASGFNSLQLNTTGTNNTAFGVGSGTTSGNLNNATALGANATVDASNKIRLGDSNVTVIEGAVSYTFTSDRNRKENLQPVEGEEVLSKLREFNFTSWNYRGQDAKQFRHYGPMAQDFFAAFGKDAVGTIGTPTTISSGDLDGVLMVAAQALEKRTSEQDNQIGALKAVNTNLKARLEALERKLGSHGPKP